MNFEYQSIVYLKSTNEKSQRSFWVIYWTFRASNYWGQIKAYGTYLQLFSDFNAYNLSVENWTLKVDHKMQSSHCLNCFFFFNVSKLKIWFQNHHHHVHHILSQFLKFLVIQCSNYGYLFHCNTKYKTQIRIFKKPQAVHILPEIAGIVIEILDGNDFETKSKYYRLFLSSKHW